MNEIISMEEAFNEIRRATHPLKLTFNETEDSVLVFVEDRFARMGMSWFSKDLFTDRHKVKTVIRALNRGSSSGSWFSVPTET